MTMAHGRFDVFRAISSTFMSGLSAGAVASLPLLAATLEAPDAAATPCRPMRRSLTRLLTTTAYKRSATD